MAEILSEFGHLVGLAGGNNIQATTMPTYSSVPLGTIVQYIGTTTADYINGYFYKATASGWEQHDTQPASNADNSITAFKESSPAQAAHAVDDYIRYNNVTYIVTVAIAIGDTLTIGTNIAVPTLDEGTVIYTPETGGGSTGGGHVIVNPSGTDMEQRASLQFVDANVTDDSTNDKTKIENVKVINSESELASASDGMYMGSYDDEADGVISADMVMYDSETTVEDELDNKVDKVTGKGLSTNDYTNEDKAKVDKIDETTTAVTGNPISISGLKSNQLAKNPIITFEPIQAGSGDPSPSNVRAISGYDKIEVLSCGKNLFDYKGNVSLVRMSNNNGTFSNVATDSRDYFSFAVVAFDKDDNVLVSSAINVGAIGRAGVGVSVGNQQTEYIMFGHSGASTDIKITYSIKLTGYFVVSLNVLGYNPSVANGLSFNDIQIEYGQTATSYEQFHKTTDLSLQIGQTVYGGTLDVETGVLTVDKKGADLGSLGWTKANTPNNKWRFNSDTYLLDAIKPGGDEPTTAICSTYKALTGNTTWIDSSITGFAIATDGRVLLPDMNYSDASTFTTAVTGQKLVYPLENPYTIQLTPHEISLLKDYAYVSTNGTNISFSYKNGEMASLGDVAQLGQTVNELGDIKGDKIVGYNQKIDLTFIDGAIDFTPSSNGILLISPNANSVFTLWFFDYNHGFIVSGGATNDNTCSIPLFKGMYVRVVSNGGTGNVAFMPYKYIT